MRRARVAFTIPSYSSPVSVLPTIPTIPMVLLLLLKKTCASLSTHSETCLSPTHSWDSDYPMAESSNWLRTSTAVVVNSLPQSRDLSYIVSLTWLDRESSIAYMVCVKWNSHQIHENPIILLDKTSNFDPDITEMRLRKFG